MLILLVSDVGDDEMAFIKEACGDRVAGFLGGRGGGQSC